MSGSEIAILVVYHLENMVLTETALTAVKLERRSDTKVFRITDPAVIDQALAAIDDPSLRARSCPEQSFQAIGERFAS